jgi:phage gpG-like protein
MRIRLKITPESLKMIEAQMSPKLSPQEAKAMGVYLVKQVRERFANGGAMGVRWPQKRFDDSRAVLTGASAGKTGGLLGSFREGVLSDGSGAFVGSDLPYARVHQLGAGPKKGGKLPAIVPRKAKALFIPLTDRARSSAPGAGAGGVRIRVPTTGPSKTKVVAGEKVRVKNPLVKGRFKNGVLEAYNEKTGTWAPGKPDFIFLKKVEIPPRPMLPDSPDERHGQEMMLRDILAARNSGKKP